MSRLGLTRLGMIGAIGFSVVILPALAAAQTSSIQVTIDSPASSALITNGQLVEISGWAVDTAAGDGTGIESVELVVDTGVASERTFAKYGVPRPDVAQVFGRPDWLQSGFSILWLPQGLPDGPHTIQVWAHTSPGLSRSSSVTVMSSSPAPIAQPPATTPVASPAAAAATAAAGSSGSFKTIENPLRLTCSIDLTLVGPSAAAQRPCPTPRLTPGP